MSRIRQMIEVMPGSIVRTEVVRTPPMVCPCCNGRGWFFTDKAKDETKMCVKCEGSGEVIATVTIDWEANKK